jgi:hypothetical protein
MSQKPTGRAPMFTRLQAHRADLAHGKQPSPPAAAGPAQPAAAEVASLNPKLSPFERELFQAWADD